jgi:hypothetical protein
MQAGIFVISPPRVATIEVYIFRAGHGHQKQEHSRAGENNRKFTSDSAGGTYY